MTPAKRLTWFAGSLRLALAGIALMCLLASCHPAPAHAAPKVPEASTAYRLRVEHAAAEFWGVMGSPARLAAQLHAESGWDPSASSGVADGLGQFTPATAAWLPTICPEIGTIDPWNDSQAIRAAACYDGWLFDRVAGASACDRWAFALSAYNGGLKWVQRDKQLASAKGADPMRWFDQVEAHSARAGWAIEQNRHYVRVILLSLEVAYIKAGWPGQQVCP